MIRRVRPNYLNEEIILKTKKETPYKYEDLYFNRGSSALKFLVSTIKEYYNKKEIIICIQSFNCPTVAQALLEIEGVKILLADVKIEDVSISLEYLKNTKFKIDILLLLHYQGMINHEYTEIVNHCKVNNIILIEDLAHVNECKHKLFGDFGIYSYAFDKPFTCMQGGKIVINNNSHLVTKLRSCYELLPIESAKKSKNDIRTLYLLYKFSSEKYYNRYVDLLVSVPSFIVFLPDKIVYYLFCNKIYNIFNAILKKLYNIKTKKNNFVCARLQPCKVLLIEAQKRHFLKLSDIIEYRTLKIIGVLNQKGKNVYLDKNQNRVSFLNNDSKNPISKEIEHGCCNWPKALHSLFKDNCNVILGNTYLNTEFLTQKLINLPVWSDSIFTKLND